MPRVVALASSEPHEPLVHYLEEAGFEVRPVRTPLGAPREGTLVWLTNETNQDRTIIETVRRWLGTRRKVRAIIVTERPVRLREAADDAHGRVRLLPAPVFGWQLVDALRDEVFDRP